MFWPGIGFDDIDFVLGWFESVFRNVFRNDVAQVNDLRLAERALVQVDFEFDCAESFHDQPEMIEMFPVGLGGYEEIIEVAFDERKLMQKVVHSSLERLHLVAKAERDAHEVKEAKRRGDSRLRYVFFCYRYLVEISL